MLIAGYAQEESSTRKDRQNRTHVDRSLTCCRSEENSCPRLAVRSLWCLATSATRTHNSAMYFGAKPCRHLYTVMHSLMTRRGTSNQWRSLWRIWPLSNFRVPVMTRAAATRCSFSVQIFGWLISFDTLVSDQSLALLHVLRILIRSQTKLLVAD